MRVDLVVCEQNIYENIYHLVLVRCDFFALSQTVSLLGYLKAERGAGGPHLVVVPLSVMSSWCTELRKSRPGLNTLVAWGAGLGGNVRARVCPRACGR